MNIEQVNKLVEKYPLVPLIEPDTSPWTSQYDTRSASINYAFVRHFKPKTVVEFGTRGGRCTHDIFKGLVDNGDPFILKPYEMDDTLRELAQKNLKDAFENPPSIGGNILEAKDLPDEIDYVFVDNFHDEKTTQWVFDVLLKKCNPGALVHFHDVSIRGDIEVMEYPHGEVMLIKKLKDEGKLPLEKLYFTYEEGQGRSSAWWKLKP